MVKIKPTVALFGGSFDPPHSGHQAIVEELQKLEDIDRIIIMPTYLSPFKYSSSASAKIRLRWCNSVFCKSEIAKNNIIISDFEVSQGRAVYTIESIEELSKNYRVKYIAIGSDNLAHITKWQDFEKINRILTWLIFTREDLKPNCQMLRSYIVYTINKPISSTELRKGQKLSHIDPEIIQEVKKINNKDKNE